MPRFDEVESKLRSYSEVCEDDCVLFVSHRWWRPDRPDGDHDEKLTLLLEKLPLIREAQRLRVQEQLLHLHLW